MPQWFRVHHYQPNEDGGYPLGALIGYLPICYSHLDNHAFIYNRLHSAKLVPAEWFGLGELIFDASRFEPVGSIFIYRRTPRLNLLFLLAIPDFKRVDDKAFGFDEWGKIFKEQKPFAENPPYFKSKTAKKALGDIRAAKEAAMKKQQEDEMAQIINHSQILINKSGFKPFIK